MHLILLCTSGEDRSDHGTKVYSPLQRPENVILCRSTIVRCRWKWAQTFTSRVTDS